VLVLVLTRRDGATRCCGRRRTLPSVRTVFMAPRQRALLMALHSGRLGLLPRRCGCVGNAGCVRRRLLVCHGARVTLGESERKRGAGGLPRQRVRTRVFGCAASGVGISQRGRSTSWVTRTRACVTSSGQGLSCWRGETFLESYLGGRGVATTRHDVDFESNSRSTPQKSAS